MQTESNEQPPPADVLSLRRVTFKGKADPATMLVDASLSLQPSDMLMWHLDRSQTTRDLASMMLGLQRPTRGEVLFEEATWLGNDFDRQFAMRSRIGRVFDDQGWVANLNLIENVRLSAEHHRTTITVIDQEVRRWCNHFSVPLISRERPAFVDAARLQIYQWVRALVSRPRLLLLERPMQSVASSWLAKLMDAVEQVRASGTAVLWFTGNSSDANADFATKISHCRLDRGTLRQSDVLADVLTGVTA